MIILKSNQYLSPKNINFQNINATKKLNIKEKTDMRMTNNFLINYEPNTSIKLSKSKLNKYKKVFII